MKKSTPVDIFNIGEAYHTANACASPSFQRTYLSLCLLAGMACEVHILSASAHLRNPHRRTHMAPKKATKKLKKSKKLMPTKNLFEYGAHKGGAQ